MKQKKVLLINPYIYDFSAYDLWARPLGLLLIGEALRKNGYFVKIIDCLHPENKILKKYIKEGKVKKPKRHPYGRGKFLREKAKRPEALKNLLPDRYFSRYGISLEMLEEELREIQKPDVIFITCIMTYWYISAFEVISFLKKFYKGVPIVLGGIYANLCYEHAKKFSNADFIYRRNNIEEILKLTNEITGNETSLKLGENFLFPCCDLLPAINEVPLLTSKGCPYKCSYCASELLGGKFVQFPYGDIFKQILYFNEKYGIVDFVFFDDALLINPEKYIKPLLRKIIDKNLNVRFHTPNGLHPKFIDEELALLMFKSGFKTIKLGLETTNEELQRKRSNNKVKTKEIISAIKFLLKSGFLPNDIGIYLIAGMIGQSVEDVIKAIEILKPYKVHIHLNEFVPIPHTKDFELIAKNCPLRIKEEPLFHNSSLLCERSKIFNAETIKMLKKMCK